MTVEIPDALRRAIEAAGGDPDEVAAQAAAIAESGELDEPEALTGVMSQPDPGDEQEPLFDPETKDIGGFHGPDSGAPETERLAAIQQYPKSGTDRRRVLDHIGLCGDRGSTDEETSEALTMRLYTAAPRRNELVEMGWVRDSGLRRQTTTGSLAAVWVLTRPGRAQWQPPGYDRD